MKKFLISTLVFSVVFCSLSNAQQINVAEAVLQPGGSQTLKVTDASGKTIVVKGNTNEEIQARLATILQTQPIITTTENKPGKQQVFVSHQAVLLKNGTQEIRWTDAQGKERIVAAAAGESLQEKYLAYLKKEHLPCGCSGPVNSLNVTSEQNNTKTAVRQ